MKRFAFVCVLLLVAACNGDRQVAADNLPVLTALSPDSVRHAGHAFSRDGQRIAYWTPDTDSTTDWLLTVANADLSSATSLGVRSIVPDWIMWHPDGSQLASVSSQYGTADIVLVTLSSGAVQRLTKDAGIEIPQGWTDDGRSLAYTRSSPDGSFRTDVLSLTDGTSRAMLPNETRPYIGYLSPKGAHVMFTLGDGSSFTIWVADSLGENRRQLTTEGFEQTVRQPWSPDGKEVLYVSTRTGTSDLWVAPIDGSAPRQLTRNVRNDFEGVWSPDGQWVAFLSDRGKQTDVWIVSVATGEERRVTNSAAEERAPLVWRAGSNELTFGVQSERSELWAVDVESGKERQLTADSLRLSDFWLSPDGRDVAIVVERGGGVRELAVVPVAGGDARTLVSNQAVLYRPLFSPDGSQLVYSSDAGGSEDIWVIDVQGGAARQLTNWPGMERSPVWSEDGTAILFLADRDTRLFDVWKVPASGGEPARLTRDGALVDLMARAGFPGTYISRISTKDGQIGVSRLQNDGSLQTVWDDSNTERTIPFSADSMLAMVEQPDGTSRAMLLSASGGGGRILLAPNERVSWSSSDGKMLVFSTPANGANDLALLTISDGTVRRLVSSPENEQGAEITYDNNTVVFMRTQAVQRIHSADLSRLLLKPEQ
jgi:TolB protein